MKEELKFEIINTLGSLGTTGEWNKEINRVSWNGKEPKYDIRPWSGYPLKYEFKKCYGLDLWICTNEHEVCDFMTNNIEAMQDIYMCDKCHNGYMVVKSRRDGTGFLYGCTNYKNIKSIKL